MAQATIRDPILGTGNPVVSFFFLFSMIFLIARMGSGVGVGEL